MKIMMFEVNGQIRPGVVVGEMITDVSDVTDGRISSLFDIWRQAPDRLLRQAPPERQYRVDQVKPKLPVPALQKVICVGLNYAAHAREAGHPIPDYPTLFIRLPTSLVADGAEICRPRASEQLDYEAELAIVIGRGGRHIAEHDALDHVLGYTIFNDGSVRDFQRRTSQMTPGKNFDRTGSLGPWIVTADELPPGAQGLRVRTKVNGACVQDSNTSDMIFPVARIISVLSEFLTLAPGDVIATGTPEGVGSARKPPLWLRHGDLVEIEIEGIGRLANRVSDEEAAPEAAAS